MAPTKVAVVEPHLLVRAGFSLILDAPADLHVVGQSEGIAGMREVLVQEHPEVVCIAAKLADGSTAIDAIEAVRHSEWSCPRLVLLVGKHDEEVVDVALRRGVSGVVSKYATPEDIVASVRAVAQGQPEPTAA